ncbi:CSN-associated deubiquitinating enzyme Ubp12 [Gryganskiella cystojenkinii]|nr:CSN-associated deubiquitinating enzyme Ubp12 [Gryganskiella cystojenkinii]
MSPSPDHDMPLTAATDSSSTSTSVPSTTSPSLSASSSSSLYSSPSSTPSSSSLPQKSTSTTPSTSTAVPAPLIDRSSVPPPPHPITAPSHKRSREPCSMTDPSEAARYTPPREMFRSNNTSTREEDDSETGSDGDFTRPDPPVNSLSSSLTQCQQSQSQHSQPHQQEHHLTSLGEQLSIHSPEKSLLNHAEPDFDLDQDLEDQDQAQAQNQGDATMTMTMSMDTEPSPLEPVDTDAVHAELPELEQTQESTVPPTPFEEQATIIQALRRKRLEEGDVWYLIEKTWMVAFQRYCTRMAAGREEDAVPPGPIDNSLLFTADGNLRQNEQFITVPQEGWDLLVSWYGAASEPVARKVINTATAANPNLMIDFHLPKFTIYRIVPANQPEDPLMAMNEPEKIEVSRSTKISELKEIIQSLFGISSFMTARIWAFPSYASLNTEGNTIAANEVISAGGSSLEHVEDDTPIVEVQDLVKAKDLAFEIKDNDEYLVPTTSALTSFTPTLSSTYSRGIYGPRASTPVSNGPAVDGICGLSNLGNTCFMNSALQCLSNTPDLTHYILSGEWRTELNTDNPLGMEGEVARSYAALIEKLWKGSNKVFSPREFKSTIGRFAPSFTGYHQHDSQELLAFLLDGLHEDLNRIIKKPYTEMPDSNGRPDNVVADDFWQIHKARNDSIIVDLFQGQYKSTLVCPECDKVSVTFDPFMYLSLPLPIAKKWVGTVSYVPYDPTLSVVDIRLQLPKGSTIRHLKEKVATMMETQGDHLFVAEVFSHRFYKSYENSDAVDEIADNDKIYVYELPVADFATATDHVVFPVLSTIGTPPTAYGRSSYTRPQACGTPMMVCVSQEEAQDPDLIYNAIVTQASRYTTFNLYDDDRDTDAADGDLIQEETDKERLPKARLFRMKVHPPPLAQPARFRSMSRPTLYAPSVPMSLDDMQDMYDRVRPDDPESDEENEDPYKVYDRHVVPVHNGLHQDLDLSLDSPDAGSPSTLSNSSRSSNRLRVPLPDEDEISEEDDPATLRQTPEPTRRRKVLRARVIQPAVRSGDMVFCVWDRTLESAIARSEHRHRFYKDDDDEESAVRPLWEARGPPVIDPVLQAELSNAKGAKKTITLDDCLAEYTKEEQLGEEDLWYCPNCKKHQQASKKLDIWRFPDILVVHLKRFSHTRAWRDKIDALVDFPIEGLDLSDKALKEEGGDDNVYDLFGVSNHMGGLGGGHYTAYAKNEKSGQWYNFDDSHVSPVLNVESIKTSSAYLLFYRRRNAPVREYEERPAFVASPSAASSSNQGQLSVTNYGDTSMMSLRPSTVRSMARDMDDDYAWSNEPFREIGPMRRSGPDNDDDDDELPSYHETIPTGPSSPAFSDSMMFSPAANSLSMGKGKGRAIDRDEEDMEEMEELGAHDGDQSTCASDGSNPGTAQGSPGASPLLMGETIGTYPPRLNVGPSMMSSISQEGGRIDDSDGPDMDTDEGFESVNLATYENVDDEAGADILSSDGSALYAEDANEEDEAEDGVNLVSVSWKGHAPSPVKKSP